MTGKSSPNDIIFVISKNAITNDEIRGNTYSSEDEEEQPNLVASCLFQDGEILDYDFIPTFSNYFYAFTSLLLSDCDSNQSLGTGGRLSKLKRLSRVAVFTLCVLFAIIVFLLEVGGMYTMMATEKNESFIYLLLLNSSLSVLACGQLLNIILRKRISLKKVFWHPKLEAMRAAKVFVYGVLISGILHAVFSGLDENGWTFSKFLNANAEMFRAVNPQNASSEGNSTTDGIPYEELELETILSGMIGCLFQYSSFVTWSFIEGLFLFAALTMKQVAEKFGVVLKASRTQGLQVKHTYEFMFRATCDLNSMIGGILAV
ncbi:unnamed protein product [Orchesella dallaii]|uniref:Uncharacterized protein n=1 Tax=Orchesella dallaii TaxID=48710 RepID=A0ABP1S1I3_9HEXA